MLRNDQLDSKEGYFLGREKPYRGYNYRSMLLTNISTDHLIAMNGSSCKNGFVIISREVTSALALVVAANYFIPKCYRY